MERQTHSRGSSKRSGCSGSSWLELSGGDGGEGMGFDTGDETLGFFSIGPFRTLRRGRNISKEPSNEMTTLKKIENYDGHHRITHSSPFLLLYLLN